MQTNLPALIPVSLVEGEPPIDVVRMPDGRPGATLRSLCALLDIDKGRQVARIRRSPGLSAALVLMVVDTPGGPQPTDVLKAWAVPTWAATLQTSRLPEKKQALALIMQQEAFAAIERAFDQPQDNPAPAQAHTSEVPQSGLRQMKEGLLLVIEGINSFEGDYQALVERVTALEGGTTHSVIGYSSRRLLQIHLWANQLRQRRGWPIDETLRALAQHFDVASHFDLRAKDWPAIRDWFTSLLEEW